MVLIFAHNPPQISERSWCAVPRCRSMLYSSGLDIGRAHVDPVAGLILGNCRGKVENWVRRGNPGGHLYNHECQKPLKRLFTSGDRISTVRRHLIRSWLFNVGREDDNILPIMPSDCKENLHEYRMHGCDQNAVASWAN